MRSALNAFTGYQRLRAPYELADGSRVFPVQSKVTCGVSAQGAMVHLIERAAATVEAGRIRYAARWLCGTASADVTLLPDTGLPGAAICAYCPAGAPGIFAYCCRAADGSPLYAGFTGSLGARLKNHSFTARWWPDVAQVTRTEHPTIAEARVAERLLIRAEKPEYNRQWNEIPA